MLVFFYREHADGKLDGKSTLRPYSTKGGHATNFSDLLSLSVKWGYCRISVSGGSVLKGLMFAVDLAERWSRREAVEYCNLISKALFWQMDNTQNVHLLFICGGCLIVGYTRKPRTGNQWLNHNGK